MSTEYTVSIMDGSETAMIALIGETSGNIQYFYDITTSSNTTNILLSGTNTTDGNTLTNTNISSFPYINDGSSSYLINDQTVTASNTPSTPFGFTITMSLYCFNKGTKILYMNQQLMDEYINIELLKIGDFVKTYKHGYRKISKVIIGSFRNNPKKWNMCMYKMAKTPENGLLEDLIVTGGHSLLVDTILDEEQKKYDEMGLSEFSKLTIDNKQLLLASVSDQFTAIQDNDVYTYYHLLLENNNNDEERFGIWANGILTETPNVKTVKY